MYKASGTNATNALIQHYFFSHLSFLKFGGMFHHVRAWGSLASSRQFIKKSPFIHAKSTFVKNKTKSKVYQSHRSHSRSYVTHRLLLEIMLTSFFLSNFKLNQSLNPTCFEVNIFDQNRRYAESNRKNNHINSSF